MVKLNRDILRLAEISPFAETDLGTTSLSVPAGTACLISALSFHNLTNEISHELDLALPREKPAPKVDFPPLRNRKTFAWQSRN